ncbi:CaiB/BaiF CoA transferase family protein [Aquabacter spiritensis]|uniref:Crotonobetainyl-CoA:carnitine CoA-transferase CaiB-like acyl-CoA transferase n=1 Tax=Aquabacter spiritensis TaxID=933073 RepID=A0A4R3LJ87_9HYPH|nr:CaiB/BaiF CoA-transferase family protein [Aquabacter spiritensis]TCT00224.1 crotonobetainyl-CoA:carnitine CoA-transferase CaiB-like acyl-CoA transferase [Aquabacter spiritensis]
MTGALDGIRVLDLSRVLAGPWATQILGDLGAEVIKVERPGAGDDTRAWGPPSAELGGEQFSAYYLTCNRNKQSIAIDIALPEGAALIRRMAREADILVENFKTGDLARYGLDYDSLRAINPRLIYCSVTGFGQTGPYAGRGGYDFLVQGMGGLMSVTGKSADDPVKVGVPVIDIFTGLYATIAIQAALHHRERSGEGQHIDCALLDTSVAILANQGMNWLVGGVTPRPMGNSHPNVVPYRTFAAADGHIIVAVGNDKQFGALCRVLGRTDLAEHPDYLTNELRNRNRAMLEPELECEISSWNSAELLAAMDAAGVPGGPINRIQAVFADPQVQARGMVVPVATPDGHGTPQVRFPAIMSSSPATIRRAPPALGADGAAILRDLGLDDTEIQLLTKAGAICLPEANQGRK